MSRLRSFAIVNTQHLGVPAKASVSLELADTDRGFLPNRLTTTQRNAITQLYEGLLIYNTSVDEFQFYDGSSWKSNSIIPSVTTISGTSHLLATSNNGTMLSFT